MPYFTEEEHTESSNTGTQGYDESTLRELDIGATHHAEAMSAAAAATPTSTSSEPDASSIIKLNNGDVLYMKEINR